MTHDVETIPLDQAKLDVVHVRGETGRSGALPAPSVQVFESLR